MLLLTVVHSTNYIFLTNRKSMIEYMIYDTTYVVLQVEGRHL